MSAMTVLVLRCENLTWRPSLCSSEAATEAKVRVPNSLSFEIPNKLLGMTIAQTEAAETAMQANQSIKVH